MSKMNISTHTLTWSVTSLFIIITPFSHYFNSHAHVERDTVVLQLVRITKISTHTLTWSVTWETGEYPIPFENFNSHAHVERDVR